MATAIRAALGLAGEVAYNTKVVEVIAHRAKGTLKNSSFPTDLWFVNLDGDRPSASAEKDLDAALLVCLVALKLTPVTPPGVPAIPLEVERFGRAVLDRAADRAAWAQDLEGVLSARMRSAVDAGSEVSTIVRELEALGHDLWSFDEAEDFAIWTYDYMKPLPGPRLSVRFGYAAYEEPEVEVTVQDSR